MQFNRAKFHTLSRFLKELPAADTILPKFRFEHDVSTIKQIAGLSIGTEVTINGWIDGKPKKIGKNLIFSTLRDSVGSKVQLVDHNSLLKNAGVEDVVQVKGTITPKRSAMSNEDGGTFELKLNTMSTLNASNKKASDLQDFKINGNYPPEYRYMQLRLPKFQAMLRKRHDISKSIRRTLDEQGFTEIETPILFKSTPEGAREFLVPTRKVDKDYQPTFYALPQSPQQYKQLLMASGVNRYFQIARCFRDEDLRADRQPEFTQVDIEMAFSSGKDVMKVIEGALVTIWNNFSSNGELLTLDSRGELAPLNEQSINIMTYKQAMTQYGIDKPDLKAPQLKILDLSEFKAYGYANKDFPVFEVLILRNAFDSIDSFNKNWSYLGKPDNYKSRTPVVVPIEKDIDRSNWFERFLPIAAFENPKLITKFLNLKQGDIVCGSTRQHSRSLFENPTPMGRLRQLILQDPLGKQLYQKTKQDVATWVVDFPLFSPVEREYEKKLDYPVYIESTLTSTHHPFTMVNISDYEKLKSNPLGCLGQHYDLVISGIELGGGSTRIHDPELQDFIFEDILKINDGEKLFGHLLQAFEMGTPPHAGFAIGFDRMCAMLCGTETIRDVIAFPKSATGSDLVVGSPSVVKEETLRAYNVEYAKRN